MINIQTDSRIIKPKDIFVAIVGESTDGHNYTDEAIEKGATKIIAEHGEYPVEYEIVENTKTYLANYLKNTYKEELSKIRFIGITGTNGKTTSAFLTYQMLNILNEKTAYIGTLGFYVGNAFIKELNHTTPDILEIYKLILESISYGCKTIVMEASSHALAQERLNGIEFDIGAFTNLTQDHLDYHNTFEEYLVAKKLILTKLKFNGKMIVNADDKFAEEFINSKSITIGEKAKDYKIICFQNNDGNIIYFLYHGKDYKVETKLLSKFNVYNFLMALAIVKESGYELEEIINISKKIDAPAGRCQTIKINNALAVIDYAHTPDAVEKIITSFKESSHGDIITVIGCGGDRDPLKRPIMARIATELSDKVIFTNDNPRTEDENEIIKDMLKGVKKSNYQIINDRKQAIESAISMLKDNDIVLILGKGHENYQIIGTKKVHFDDVEIVKKYSQN